MDDNASRLNKAFAGLDYAYGHLLGSGVDAIDMNIVSVQFRRAEQERPGLAIAFLIRLAKAAIKTHGSDPDAIVQNLYDFAFQIMTPHQIVLLSDMLMLALPGEEEPTAIRLISNAKQSRYITDERLEAVIHGAAGLAHYTPDTTFQFEGDSHAR